MATTKASRTTRKATASVARAKKKSKVVAKKVSPRLKLDKQSEPLYYLHEYHVDLQLNHVFIMGNHNLSVGVGTTEEEAGEPGVEYTMTNRLILNLHTCQNLNPGMDLVVHLKTNGGFWEEGMAGYNTLITYPGNITVINYTHARSMSSLLFLAGVKRVMMPDSSFMFHEGTMGMYGTQKQFRTEAEWALRSSERMLDIYVDALREQGSMSGKGWTDRKVRKWLVDQMDKKEEVYTNAVDSVKLGFADEVFSGDWGSLTEYTPQQLKRRERYLSLNT